MADAAQISQRHARAVLRAAFCMAILACGCATRQEVTFDAKNPAIRVSRQGILFGDEFVKPEAVPGILYDYDVPKTRTIHIRLDPDVRDLGPARTLMGYLGMAGYMNPILVTEKHAAAINIGKPKKGATNGQMSQKNIQRKFR